MLQALHQGAALREHLHQRQEQVQKRAGLRMLGRAFATVALSSLAFIPAADAQWCSEPSKPSCLDIGQPDSWCRDEVEQYLAREKQFRDCLVDEANQRIEESKRRARQVVERWNCYAEGNSFCF
jgi:hypothetical protein